MSKSRVTPQEAAAELLRRRKARKRAIDFARYIDVPGAVPLDVDADVDDADEDEAFHTVDTPLADHHKLILDACQRCIERPHGRLMLFMPPGSAKTTYANVILPAFVMGTKPGSRILSVSYGDRLTRKNGRRTRAIVQQPSYRALFETGLSKESSAADEWALENGSEYMSGAIQSGITGTRMSGGIADDLIRGRADANSPAIRERVWDAYNDDFLTRLIPKAWIIFIMTRWHEDDPAGRLLPKDYAGESGMIECQDGDVWEVINLPAKAERHDDPLGREPGEYLWPEWFDAKHWARFERMPRTWASLYQQRPSPEEGDLFQRSWLRYYDKAPSLEQMRTFGASDYAVTDDGGDYTVHIVVGIDAAENIYVLDVWRKQTSSDVWVETFCDMVQRYKPMRWAEETGQIKSGVGPFLERRMRQRRTFVPRQTFPTRGDKAVRAQSIRGRIAMDGLYLPIDAPWREAFEHELLTFPGRNDDQVDALGLIGQLLDQMYPPLAEDEKPKTPEQILADWQRKQEERRKPKDWFADDEKEDAPDWKVV